MTMMTMSHVRFDTLSSLRFLLYSALSCFTLSFSFRFWICKVLITFRLSLLRHCILVSRQSVILSNSLRVFFLSIETVCLPIFEELSNFPQIAVLISMRTCRYFQNNIQVCFSYIYWKHFCKPFFDQAENGMFLPDRKNMISFLYTEDRNFQNTNAPVNWNPHPPPPRANVGIWHWLLSKAIKCSTPWGQIFCQNGSKCIKPPRVWELREKKWKIANILAKQIPISKQALLALFILAWFRQIKWKEAHLYNMYVSQKIHSFSEQRANIQRDIKRLKFFMV